MFNRLVCGISEARAARQKTRRPRAIRSLRHVPQVHDVLERRELLTTFPLTGTFSGSYSVMAAYGGIGQGPTASGTITLTINVSSVVNVGYEANQAIIYGTISATGFLGHNLTYSYTGTAEAQNAIEAAYGTGEDNYSVELVMSASDPNNYQNFIEIPVSECYDNSINASVNISYNNYNTPNAASVILSGGGSGSSPGGATPPSNPAEPTGASVVKGRKGVSQVVVNFSGPLDGGSGLPLNDFQLATAGKGKHAKVIRLARVAYDPSTDAITLTPRQKLDVRTPLKLTVSGLAEGPFTLIVDKH
jgi:hypothetical protein